MTPVEVLNELVRVDRSLARPLIAGLAVIAAAAIVSTWDIDFQSAVFVGVYIVGLGALLYFVGFLFASLGDLLIKRIFGWFILIFIMLVMTTFFVSAACPKCTPIAPTPCLVRFLEDCDKVLDRVADRNYTPVSPVKEVSPPPTAQVRPNEYQVFVQFAGIIRREDVRAMMSKLRDAGWRVQGVDGGGQRTPKAAGVNEIRYTAPGAEQAARALALAVQSANLTTKTINPTQVPSPPIAANTLEVWISR